MLFRQKWIKLVSCLLLLVTFVPAGLGAKAAAGSWSDFADTAWYNADYVTFTVDTPEKLAGVSELVYGGIDFSGKTLEIIKDLNLSEHEWRPIGTPEHPFRGILIGKSGLNPAVTGLTVKGGDYVGLVGYMHGATVGRFTLAGNIEVHGSGDVYVGSVAGYMDQKSTILDVVSSVDIQASGSPDRSVHAGGIAGSASGLMSNVNNQGDITVSGFGEVVTGGIAGASNGELALKKNQNSGPVSVTGSVYRSDAGGIIGFAQAKLDMDDEDTFIRNSGQLTVQNSGSGALGGIVGRAGPAAAVEFSAQTSNSGRIQLDAGISATDTYAGGLIGSMEIPQETVSHANLMQSGEIVHRGGVRAYTGGIAGSVAGNLVWKQAFLGNVPVTVSGVSELYTGGLIGKAGAALTFESAAANQETVRVDASGDHVYTGGLAGYAANSLTLKSSAAAAYSNTGSITVGGTASDVYTGGIIANRSYTKAANNVASSGVIAVTGAQRLYTGGYFGMVSGADPAVAGEAFASSIQATSTASADETHEVYTGGIAGYLSGATVSNVTVGGSASTPALLHSGGQVGGVAGYANGEITQATVRYTQIEATGVGGAAGGIAGVAQGRIAASSVGDAAPEAASDNVSITVEAAEVAAGGVIGKNGGNLRLESLTAAGISLESSAAAAQAKLGGLAGVATAQVMAGTEEAPVTVHHITVNAAGDDNAVGGVIGRNEASLAGGRLQEVSGISIQAQGNRSALGGIVGSNSGVLTDLAATGIAVVSGGADNQVGGLVGFTDAAVIRPQVYAGETELALTLQGAGASAGGVAGVMENASVNGDGTAGNTAGLAVNAGATASGARIGGIIGFSNASPLTNVIAESPIITTKGANTMVGGLAGEIAGANITDSALRGMLPEYAVFTLYGADSKAGGVAGKAHNSAITGDSTQTNVENLLITGADTAANLIAGGVAGHLTEGSLNNLYGQLVKLTVKGPQATVGGLAGYNRGLAGYGEDGHAQVIRGNYLENLTIDLATAAASSTTGGLIGINDARTDEDSEVDIASAVSSIGSSRYTGSVTVHAPNAATGGLVGDNRTIVANNSIAEKLPVVSDGNNGTVGGLIGKNSGTVYYSYSNSNVTASGESTVTGGLAGLNTGSVIASYTETDLTGNAVGTSTNYAALGGLIGKNTGEIRNSFTSAVVTSNGAYTFTGGLVGDHGGSVANSYAAKNVTAHGAGSYSGGLVGRMTTGTVGGSYSGGQVAGDNGAYAGGFAGYYDNASKELIDNTYYVKDESKSINSGLLDFGGGTYYELNQYSRLSPILSTVLADRNAFPALSGWTFSDTAWRYGSENAEYRYPELNLSANNGGDGGNNGGGSPVSMNINWYTKNPGALTFTLQTEADLAGLAAIVNGTVTGVDRFDFRLRTIQLTAPVHIQSTHWDPIGADTARAFQGEFVGNGNLISGLKVSGDDYTGLFGVIGSHATVRQVSLEPVNVTGTQWVGALAGLNLGKVANISVVLSSEAQVTGGNYVGGIIGQNTGTITGLNFAAKDGGTVSSTAANAAVGGLVGDNQSAITASDVVLTGGAISASGEAAAVGGLAGKQTGDIQNSKATLETGGSLQASGESSLAGGLAGLYVSGTANDIAVTFTGGTIRADGAGSIAGGMIGRSQVGQTVKNAVVTGTGGSAEEIAAAAAAGGIVGDKAGLGTNVFELEKVEVKGASFAVTAGRSALGGIAGKLTDTAVKEAVFQGTLAASQNDVKAGGIAGSAYNSILYLTEAAPKIAVSAAAGENIPTLAPMATETRSNAAGGIAGVMETGGEQRDAALDFGYYTPFYPGIYDAKVTEGSIVMTGAGQTLDLYAGGLAGKLLYASLYNSVSSAAVEVTGASHAVVGGAAGLLFDSVAANITVQSQLGASNSSNFSTGGLVGQAAGSEISYSRASALNNKPIVIGESVAANRQATYARIGGFAGQADATTIKSASADMAIEATIANPYATISAGGFAGILGDTAAGTISEAYAKGSVTLDGKAGAYAGGFAGVVNGYDISQTYATGNVKSTSFDARGGGFAGVVYQGAAITDAYAMQDEVYVAGTGTATRAYAGGFAGYNDGSLSRVYAKVARITSLAGGANSYMGALIGYNFRDGRVADSYSTGSLAAIMYDTSSGQSANVKPLPEDGQPLANWSFSGDAPVWVFAGNGDSVVPALAKLSGWRFAPELGFMTTSAKNAAAFEVAAPEQLAGFALLQDEGLGLYRLYNRGAVGVPAVTKLTLTADIALEGKLWTPIAVLRGELDGGNHSITGLKLHLLEGTKLGLVSENQGVITNLTLLQPQLDGAAYTGAAAGLNGVEGMISHVAVKGGAVSASTAAGGIAGSNEGSIQTSHAGGRVTASQGEGGSAAGGIAGIQSDEGSISESFSYAEVSAEAAAADAGGIAGVNHGAIADSYNTGSVGAKGVETARAGGVAGYAAGTLTGNMSGGQASASVGGMLSKGQTFAGGVAGQLAEAAVLTGNLYDMQMLQFPIAYYTGSGSKVRTEAGQAEGLSTAQLVGGVLPAGLNPSVWNAQQGFYPQLTRFAGTPESGLSTAAVVLADGDTAFSVTGAYRTAGDASITWTTAASGSMTVLTASKAGASRAVAIGRTPLVYEFTAAAPTSPTEKQFKEKTGIVLETTEADAVIYYTTNGAQPTELSAVYTQPIDIKDTATIKAIAVVDGKNNSAVFTAEFKKIVQGGGGGGGGAPSNVTASVGGKDITSTVSQSASGTETVVVLKDEAVKALLKEGQKGTEVAVAFSDSVETATVELNAGLVKDMAAHEAVLLVKSHEAVYRVPAGLLAQAGTESGSLRITVAQPSAAELKQVQEAAKANGYEIQISPVAFKIAKAEGKQLKELGKLAGYAERILLLPNGRAASKSPAGAMVNANGTFSPVPSRLISYEGKQAIALNSVAGSGTFAVISSAAWDFNDAQGHWAQASIGDLAARRMVGGSAPGMFEPDRSITRAEFAAIAVKALGLEGTGATALPFQDVIAADWYAAYLASAYEYGLISGFEDGTIRAQEEISRQQAMAILARAMALTGLPAEATEEEADSLLAAFEDADSIADYAKTAIAASVKAGLVSGRTGAEIAPDAPMTRAEVATIIQKLLKLSGFTE
ncbi:S-layer homology domain-containing protein [Paenibacillus sp. YN15]|uniref:S-layer homology domain-containing protein n=1 Tax=Paenibacillus sp. YN15 TaxID=1742774 RepID=UPI000DCEB67E|nr:S-layer homology domain-containing protein [Paenibacillus sp. YN15]RAU97892.1 hypothetical protein DQG13_18080 [Paenibacillus sp. YN15]